MAISDRSARYLGTGCLVLFATPFIGVGVWMAWKLGTLLWLAVATQAWIETPATLISVELEVHDGDESDTYQVLATYQYTFAGRQQSSDRVGLDTGADNISSYHQRIYGELQAAKQAGQPISCYVNPRDPSQAILDRSLRPLLVLFHLPFILGFGGVGFGLLIGGYYGSRRVARNKARRAAAPDEPWLWNKRWESGLVRSSNYKSMVGIGLFTTFWNLVSLPTGILFLLDDKPKEWWSYPLMLILPAFGMGMLGCSELVIEKTHWRIRSGWYGMRGKPRNFPPNEITKIGLKEGMTSTSGNSVKQSNHVMVHLRDGSKLKAVRSLSSRQTERKLLAELRERAGLAAPEEPTEPSPWEDLDDAPSA